LAAASAEISAEATAAQIENTTFAIA
jgi:hypothetical protein